MRERDAARAQGCAGLDWRPIRGEDDVATVAAIAAVIHKDLPESAAVFAEKIKLFPDGCLTARQDGEMLGYGISHPWRLYEVPALDAFLGGLPASPDCLYVHDVAILPKGRGRNMAGRYLDLIREIARNRGIARLACVSVYGTSAFWMRHGFHEAADQRLQASLEAYGPTARYMIADVAG